MRPRVVLLTILGVIAATVLSIGFAAAGGGTLDGKVLTGQQVTVASGETVDHDLYVFGGAVVIDGIVTGDLVAFAGNVTINGAVDGDFVTGAGNVTINGVVKGDVRAGAGTVVLSGSVGEDLLVGSGALSVTSTGTVGEDLIFGSGDVWIDGSIEGSVLGSASRYELSGSVGGSQQVTVSRPGRPGQPNEPAPPEAVQVAGDGLRQFVSVLLFGALALWLIPGVLRTSGETLRRRPLASAGIGIGVLVGFLIQFIAVILLIILAAIALGTLTLDGLSGVILWAGILELMFTTFALVVGAVFVVDFVVGFALAQLVAARSAPSWNQNRWKELGLLAAGSAGVVLLTMLPVVGPIIKLVVIVLGLGAMFVAAGEWWQRRHPPAAPPAQWVPQPTASAPPPSEPPAAAPPAEPPAAV